MSRRSHLLTYSVLKSQHEHFNKLLNELRTASSQPGHPSTTLAYDHLRLVDSFYSSEGSGDRDKIRVTRNEKTNEVIESLRKVRLGNLDIYSPKRAADWRISVNVEVPGEYFSIGNDHPLCRAAKTVPVKHPIGTATLKRRKDRMSYSHEEFRIDLTQVTSQAAQSQQVRYVQFSIRKSPMNTGSS